MEHFIEIVPVKRADDESFYSALMECLWSVTFSGSKTGVQTRLRKLSPHAILILYTATVISFNWLVCKLPMLLQVSSMCTVCHIYYFVEVFHFSPKRAQSLKEVQKVLDLLELKIVKHTNGARKL